MSAALSGVQALEFGWSFAFSNGVVLGVDGVWRILGPSGLLFTSQDHGESFGLPAPIDARAAAVAKLGGAVVAVNLEAGTADVRIRFHGDVALEVLTLSSGYEAWHLTAPATGAAGFEIVANGGRLHLLAP